MRGRKERANKWLELWPGLNSTMIHPLSLKIPRNKGNRNQSLRSSTVRKMEDHPPMLVKRLEIDIPRVGIWPAYSLLRVHHPSSLLSMVLRKLYRFLRVGYRVSKRSKSTIRQIGRTNRSKNNRSIML